MRSSRRPVDTILKLVLTLMVGAMLAGLLSATATAHELRPAIIAASVDETGLVELRVAINLEAQIAGIGPGHTNTTKSAKAPVYDRLRTASPAMLRKAFTAIEDDFIDGLRVMVDGGKTNLALKKIETPAVGDISLARVSTLVLTGMLPSGANSMTWRANAGIGENVFRVSRKGETSPFFSAFLSAGKTSRPIMLNGVIQQPAWRSLVEYVGIGFDHILPKGLDHILFIVGLFLLSPYLRPLLWQVTGFTLAHSVTLALGIYGVVSIPAVIVEPLIAASIIFIAVENLFTDRLRRWRPAVIFGFGLLHGLGFAGVLSEFGLPQGQFATAMIGFNIGVELGQLTILAACFLGVGLWLRHRHWYRRAVSIPASAAVALIAAFWFVERVA